MSVEDWTLLRAPVPSSALRWHVAQLATNGDGVRLALHVDPTWLRGRLDEIFGAGAWSMTVNAWTTSALLAEFAAAGVRRGAVVAVVARAGLAASPDEAAPTVAEAATGAAWTAALEACGLVLPWVVTGDAWVEVDPDSGDPLYPPEVRELDVVRGGGEAADALEVEGAQPAALAAPSTQPLGVPRAEDAAAKPEGHKLIDRIVERLRAEGLGADVARLVTRYGGYGADAESSRALYAELRTLLRERTQSA